MTSCSSDTVCDLGGAGELANYGEYSGDPSESQTYEYAKTIIKMMTEGAVHPAGKVLIVGGSIANFTNVAKTFKVVRVSQCVIVLRSGYCARTSRMQGQTRRALGLRLRSSRRAQLSGGFAHDEDRR